MDKCQIIGNALKEERIKKGISLEQMAIEINVDEKELDFIENVGIWSDTDVPAICKVLGINKDDVYNKDPIIKKGIFRYNSFENDIIDTDYDSRINEGKLLNKNMYIYCNDFSAFNKYAEKLDGYEISLLDLKYDLSQSCVYNPLAFLKTNLDILQFCDYVANHIIKDKDAIVLLQSMIFYLKSFRPQEEWTFTNIMKLLYVSIDFNYESKTKLDRLFEQCMRTTPYISFIQEFYGINLKTRLSAISNIVSNLFIFDFTEVQDLTSGEDFITFEPHLSKQAIFIIPPANKVLEPILEMFNYQLSVYLQNQLEDNLNLTNLKWNNNKDEERKKREKELESKIFISKVSRPKKYHNISKIDKPYSNDFDNDGWAF